jgi:hypothetical protein
LTILDVAVGYRSEDGVIEVAADETIKQRGEPGDRCGDDQTARANDAPSLLERSDPLASLGQVIERAEQEHRIERGIPCLEPASIAQPHGERALGSFTCSGRLLYMERHRIDKVNGVSDPRPPRRIHAWTATHVQDRGRRRRQDPFQQLLRTRKLDPGAGAAQQAVLFNPGRVVREDLIVHHEERTCWCNADRLRPSSRSRRELTQARSRSMHGSARSRDRR